MNEAGRAHYQEVRDGVSQHEKDEEGPLKHQALPTYDFFNVGHLVEVGFHFSQFLGQWGRGGDMRGPLPLDLRLGIRPTGRRGGQALRSRASCQPCACRTLHSWPQRQLPRLLRR